MSLFSIIVIIDRHIIVVVQYHCKTDTYTFLFHFSNKSAQSKYSLISETFCHMYLFIYVCIYGTFILWFTMYTNILRKPSLAQLSLYTHNLKRLVYLWNHSYKIFEYFYIIFYWSEYLYGFSSYYEYVTFRHDSNWRERVYTSPNLMSRSK